MLKPLLKPPASSLAIVPLLLLAMSACTPEKKAEQQTQAAETTAATMNTQFDWFEYTGRDKEFAIELQQDEYLNPVLAGYHPDPSITRVEDDYYLVNSSFGHWPGLPIFHSTDLVNWQQIGHALDRVSQLDFNGIQVASDGIYAPTIRYHDGLFYIVTTAVRSGGNFLITAKDPAGPWSEPVFLPEINGIDPDIFFDDDGKTFIAHNGPPAGVPLYNGHRAVWLWEFDLENMKVVPDSGRLIVDGGTDISKKPIWIEGPHIYKKDGWYYLTCAQDGTGPFHSQVIFRARELTQPFEPYENNPILTQRDLPAGRPYPIDNAGHADFVQTQTGDWWAVFLATRNYQQEYSNIGRETYLLPISWQSGWPIILEAGKTIPYRNKKPALPFTARSTMTTGNFTWRDDFDDTSFDLSWKSLRGPWDEWAGINHQQETLVLIAKPETLSTKATPAFLARKQQHNRFIARTKLETPKIPGMSTGIAAFQNEGHYYYFGVRAKEDASAIEFFLERAEDGKISTIAESELSDTSEWLIIGIEGNYDKLSFFYLNAEKERISLADDVDAKILSSQVAGGFVGVHLGLHARLSPSAE